MWDERYRQILKVNMPTTDEMASDSKDLLQGVLLSIALNDSKCDLQAILEQNRRRLASDSKSIRDVDELAEIAAAAELLGQSSENELRLCLQQAQTAFEEFGQDDRIIEPALGAAMLLGDDNAVHIWRDRRLAIPLMEEVESIGFEMLYLSSRYVENEFIASVAVSVVRVALDILMVFSLQSPCSHICALGSLARRHSVSTANLLHGVADKLDKETFGSMGVTPLFRISKPSVEFKCDVTNGPTMVIRVLVEGEGILKTEAYPIEVFSSKLLRTIQENLDEIERMRGKMRDQQRQLAHESLYQDGGCIRAILCLGADVNLQESDQIALEARLSIAWEHARILDPRLKANVVLIVER